MTQTFAPYPTYGETAGDLLGRLPVHWQAIALKRVVANNDGGVWGSDPSGEGDTIVLRSTEQTASGAWNIKDPAFRKLSPAEYVSGRLQTGDLLITKSSGSALHIGKTTLVTPEVESLKCCYSNFMQRLRLNAECESRFGWYLLNNELVRSQFDLLSNTTTGLANLNGGIIGLALIPLPPAPEQRTITAFLDYETARIDALIAKQKRLIELLKEKRQAVISHAVTKGLNPDAPVKDSSVEWLGKVPAHWVVSRIKNYAKIESGHTPDKKKDEYWTDCDIPWVSLNDSKTLKVVDYIDDTAYKVNDLGIANSSARLLPARAVVFTRDASIGLSAITTKPMAVSQHLIAWLCNSRKLLPEYLLLVFYGMEKEFERYTFGATIKTIGMDDVRSLTAAIPPAAEQKTIVDWAFRKLAVLKNGVSKAEGAVQLLQERRTALISAAVTGKIDLRNWRPAEAEREAEHELPLVAEPQATYQAHQERV